MNPEFLQMLMQLAQQVQQQSEMLPEPIPLQPNPPGEYHGFDAKTTAFWRELAKKPGYKSVSDQGTMLQPYLPLHNTEDGHLRGGGTWFRPQ